MPRPVCGSPEFSLMASGVRPHSSPRTSLLLEEFESQLSPWVPGTILGPQESDNCIYIQVGVGGKAASPGAWLSSSGT